MLLSKVLKRRFQTSAAAKRWNINIKFVTLHSSLVRINIFLRVMAIAIMPGANKMLL
jgi:hypothetical protein